MKFFISKNKLDVLSLNLQKNPRFSVLKTIIVIIFVSLIGTLLVNRFLLNARVYIPGLYAIAQTIAYQIKDVNLSGPFYYRDFFFFLITFIINLPLIIGAYFLINKRYGLFSGVGLTIWTGFGFFFSLKVIKNSPIVMNLDLLSFARESAERTKQVQYYILALFAGLIAGFLSSFIWRQNISMGGLDVIFTYLSIKKRKEIQKVTIPVIAVFAPISIIINEHNQAGFDVQTFISLFFASLIFIYARNLTINYFYPKYRIVQILVVTKKPVLVRNELRKFYLRGGNIIAGRGLYDQQDKTIIITAMTYLEKDIFIKKINKVDPQAFLIGVDTSLLKGNFLH